VSLPKVETLKYDVKIDELNQTLKYRPFTVKEHKLLLQAIEMKDEASLVNVILDLVTACTFNKINLNEVPVHVVDFLYLLIHAKSTGAGQIANYTCNNPVLQEDNSVKTCGGSFKLKVDLEKAKIVYPKAYKEKQVVKINENVGIKLRVPNFEDFKKIKLDDAIVDITDHFIFSCIDSIYEGETVQVPGIDFTSSELIEWLNGLDGSVMEKISEFFKELPYLGLELPVTCPKCGKKEVVGLKGLEDFFA